MDDDTRTMREYISKVVHRAADEMRELIESDRRKFEELQAFYRGEYLVKVR